MPHLSGTPSACSPKRDVCVRYTTKNRIFRLLVGSLLLPASAQGNEIDQLLSLSIDELSAEIVTARRRPEPLQRVPLSVTQISAEQMADHQVENLADLRGLVPNLTAHTGDAANAVIYIRGIGQLDSLFFSEAGVGSYLDEVYLGCPQCATPNFLDLERIEVLRGPQGTLYGKNTIAGAVKYVTRPLTADPEARVTLGSGSHNEKTVSGIFASPLGSEQLLARLAFSAKNREGLARNTFTDQEDHDRHDLSYRAAVKWLPTSDLAWQFTFDGSRKQPRHSWTPHRETALLTYPVSGSLDQVEANYANQDQTRSTGFSAVLDWRLSPRLELKSVTAYRKLDYASKLDLDATGARLLDTWYQLAQQQFSQEAKLVYNGQHIDSVFGLYYLRDVSQAFDGVDYTELPGLGFGTASQTRQTTHSQAIFAESTYRWNERLSFVGGLRYTLEKKDFQRDFEKFLPGDLPQPDSGIGFHPGFDGTGPYQMKKSWASLSPRIGTSYQWHPALMAYANISSGFKSGGFDGRSQSLPGDYNRPYNPEKVTSYETGVKSTWLDKRLVLNASLFHNDYRDIQLSVVPDSTFGQPVLVNAGKAFTRGAELEFQIRPPLRGLTLRGALGYLQARYREFISAAGNLADERKLAHAPTRTYLLGAVYQTALANGARLRYSADLRSLHDIYPTVSGNRLLYENRVTLYNAQFSYESPDRRWLTTLAGNNLGNARYRQHAFDFGNSLGAPLAMAVISLPGAE